MLIDWFVQKSRNFFTVWARNQVFKFLWSSLIGLHFFYDIFYDIELT